MASRIKSKGIPANIFTARKRSLRRLCFYRCLSVHNWGGGACVVFLGGVHGFFQGACIVFARGVCMVFFQGWGVGVVFLGGVRGFFWGVRGMHGFSGGVRVFFRGDVRRIRRDMVNERAVCILLECILVKVKSGFSQTSPLKFPSG